MKNLTAETNKGPNITNLRELIYKHALLNAYKHGGKASLKHVVSKVIAEDPSLRSEIKNLMPTIREVIEQVNSMELSQQKKELEEKYPDLLEEKREEEAKTLPPLPGADLKRNVVTRFAPNPDFVIHLGNSRVAILSHEYARMYEGKFILRFEDTDPRTKTPLSDAYLLIKEDLSWLGIRWDEEYIQSLRMETYYSVARKLIERGGAYVDTLSKEEFARLLKEGTTHPNRDDPPEDVLEKFDKMLEGAYGEGEAVLRVKTDWHHKDKSVVDWVAFRIIDTDKHPHPLTGSKYIVWPTYNFAAGVDDHLMGVTHIIRGKEHAQNTVKQSFLYKHMGWQYPYTISVGRLKLEDFIMSKSVIREILSKTTGYYGHDDPRFATLSGLRKRGILPESIRAIMIEVGVKKNDARISFDNLAAINRKLLDPIAPRLSFVPRPMQVTVVLDSKECLKSAIPLHPDRPEMGKREWRICSGDQLLIPMTDYLAHRGGEMRLMELGNFTIQDTEIKLVNTSLDYARRKKLSIIQWLPLNEASNASILVPKGERLEVLHGMVDKMAAKLENKLVQFYRIGFAKIERVYPMLQAIFAHE